jgi:hypothetical protein
MKKKLLFLALILLTTLKGFSQAEAYPAPDINQCGSEVFNLTVQTPIILGNQGPLNFSVTYYLTQADAAAGTNPVVNPTFYVSPQQQLIFAKVVNLLDNSSDITVFHLSWVSGVFVPTLPDVQACEAYELIPLTVGNYYTGPNGTGVMLNLGDNITQTQVIYIYAENDLGCSAQSVFTVTIISVPVFNDPEPLTACLLNNDGLAIFDLTSAIPQILGNVTGYTCTFHQTQAAAENGVNAIANPQAYYGASSTIYISIVQSGTVSNCRWVAAIELIPITCNGNTISGFASLNFDDNCETFEAAALGIPVYMTHNNDVYITYTNADGYYSFINVPEGVNTVYINETPSATVSPSSYEVTMPGNAVEKNFCITTEGEVINDIAVTLIPISQARPGFPASYALIYQNLGNVTQNGDVTVQFDTANLTFTNAIPAMAQSGNTVTLSYTNLYPFQSKVALVYFTVNVPQITPVGTVLNFTANITPLIGDANQANNTSAISQITVGSYDPNDIAVREGQFITEAQTDDYLNYTVRFQNTGSANAEKVRVIIPLHDNLDWSTFEAMTASHAFTVKHTGNQVEFLFDAIDLAYQNEATGEVPESNGYFIYRIKPKASVTLGDSMSAQANIFFDFNDPIETNEVTTTVQNVAGLDENSFDSFTVHPNPASGNVNLTLANANATGFDVSVIDVLGKKILKNTFQSNEANLDITSLNSGVYFINVIADGKHSTKKLIVK